MLLASFHILSTTTTTTTASIQGTAHTYPPPLPPSCRTSRAGRRQQSAARPIFHALVALRAACRCLTLSPGAYLDLDNGPNGRKPPLASRIHTTHTYPCPLAGLCNNLRRSELGTLDPALISPPLTQRQRAWLPIFVSLSGLFRRPHLSPLSQSFFPSPQPPSSSLPPP